ncbi:MAG: hypothetical protein KGJ89_03590 [Patescibacteria group bacterium]|nr:hypothetical protein [Patescibacteria group bacterium]MDE2015370.1 hypothetical protein [Patescibacteria group bacterium]MDE2227015.1 hypothetical protein [Patescibacteria group bacterium]
MKRILPVIIAVVAVAVGIVWYIGFRSAPTNNNSTTGSNPLSAPLTTIPIPNVPIPASSYGKDASGSTSTYATGLIKPQPTQAVGILGGSTKIAPGATISITSVKVSISDPQTNKVLDTTNISANDTYQFTVLPGEYVVNIVSGTGSSDQLPKRVYVGANEHIDVNFLVK